MTRIALLFNGGSLCLNLTLCALLIRSARKYRRLSDDYDAVAAQLPATTFHTLPPYQEGQDA